MHNSRIIPRSDDFLGALEVAAKGAGGGPARSICQRLRLYAARQACLVFMIFDKPAARATWEQARRVISGLVPEPSELRPRCGARRELRGRRWRRRRRRRGGGRRRERQWQRRRRGRCGRRRAGGGAEPPHGGGARGGQGRRACVLGGVEGGAGVARAAQNARGFRWGRGRRGRRTGRRQRPQRGWRQRRRRRWGQQG